MIRSIFTTIVFFAFAAVTAATAADVVEGIETTAAKCTQSALNDLKKNAGAVDGMPGRGTNAAASRYLEDEGQSKNPLFGWIIPVNKQTSAAWCLYLYTTENSSLEPKTIALAEAVAADAVVKFPIMIVDNKKPKFSISFDDEAGNRLWESHSEKLPEKNGTWTATIPYLEVAKADRVHTRFEDGWSVLDANGNRFPESVNQVNPAFFVPERYPDGKAHPIRYKVTK